MNLIDSANARKKLLLKTRLLFGAVVIALLVVLGLLAMFTHVYLALAFLSLQIIIVVRSILRYANYGKKLIKEDGVVPVNERTHPELYKLIDDVARRMGTKTPPVYIQQSRQINAFAFSSKLNQRAISFTSGWLENADPWATRGVIAHELSHVVNRDWLIQSLFQGLTTWGTAVKPKEVKRSSYSSRQDNNAVELIFTIIFFIPRMIFFIVYFAGLWLSRTREYLADLTAARGLGGSTGVLSCLYMLEAMDAQAREKGARPRPDVLSTHPGTQRRINFILDTCSRQAGVYNP